MSLLDRVIDGASDDTVSTGNLLRQVITLGRRMKSDDLVTWAMSELNGYPETSLSDLPAYRGPLLVPVEVFASGYFQSSKKYFINKEDFPDENEFRKWQFHTWLYQPMAELERLAAADVDPGQAWPNQALAVYIALCEQNRAPHYADYNPLSVRKIIPRTMLHGIIDSVRTRALLFALDVQAEFPNAGEPNGPTTDTPKVREAVTFNINNHIYGGTNTVANGENITQNVQIKQGDTEALLSFFKNQGLDDAGQAELRSVIAEDGDKPGPGVEGFLKKLALGTIKFGGAAATPALTSAAKVGLGLFFGVPIP